MKVKQDNSRTRGNIIGALLNDCFAVLSADFSTGQIRLIRADVGAGCMEKDILSFGGKYKDFFDYYIDNYTEKSEKTDYKAVVSEESVRAHLIKEPVFAVLCTHIHNERVYPTEIRFADISDNQDGSSCIIAFRYTGDVIKYNPEEREKNDLIAALVRYYTAIYYMDLNNDTFKILRAENVVNTDIYQSAYLKRAYSDTMRTFADKFVRDEDREEFSRLTCIDYIRNRLETEESYSFRYRVKHLEGRSEFFELRIVRTMNDDKRFAIMAVRNLDKEIKAELRYQLEIENANKMLKEALEKEMIYQRELKNALNAARFANQAKTDFLSRMSHDIRTPMNAIIGMTAIAGAHMDDAERVKDCLAKISSSSRHLLGIINDILDMSKIESGKMEIKEDTFKLSDLVSELLDMVNPQIQAKKHNLKVHINNIKHETVIGDYTRLQQALVNIMTNAIKYTLDSGNITLTVTEKETRKSKTGCYEFIFEDNGIGMSEELTKRIFEPFERGEDLRISKIQGTGLGMPITKNIIQMMGGTIDVESVLGKGSRFTVVVTLKLSDTEEIDASELFGLSVLVADDDEISCETACMLLNDIGMDSEWVQSGREALERVVERHSKDDDYFAVILDWKMPDMDGIETTRRIRKEVGENIPIIIVSAYDWSDIELDARMAGANAFISKPIFKSGLTNMFKMLVHPDTESAGRISRELDVLKEQDFSAKRILLVEDNDLNREIAAELIKTTGVSIDEAEDGRRAVEMVKAAPDNYYDMILMDIQMPNMNGYEATKAIRALEKPGCADMPIIAMTANTFDEDVRAAMNAGMNEHVAKPIDFRQLNDVMKAWLG